MESATERRVSADELFELVTDVFQRCGMDGRDAHLLADSLVAADLAGVHSHGVLRVPEYVKKLIFKARVDQAIRQIHACRRAPGVDRVYAPGEIEALNRIAYRSEGIPLNQVTLADLRRTAGELGVDTSRFAWLE